jgi:hypothetical protein
MLLLLPQLERNAMEIKVKDFYPLYCHVLIVKSSQQQQQQEHNEKGKEGSQNQY